MAYLQVSSLLRHLAPDWSRGVAYLHGKQLASDGIRGAAYLQVSSLLRQLALDWSRGAARMVDHA